MKRIKNSVCSAILILSLLLIGFGEGFAKGRVTDIKPGMTQEQVIKLLGKPKMKNFTKENECWEYRKNQTSADGVYVKLIATITFEQGLVTELTTEEIEPNPDQVSSEVSRANAVTATASLLQEIVAATSSASSTRGGGGRSGRSMSEDRFNQYYANVKARTFDREKKEEIRMGATGNLFNCNQCARLVNTLTFDRDKMEVVEMLAGKIVDKENYRQLEECFTFDSDKKKVRNAVASAATPSHCAGSKGDRAMSEDHFNRYYDQVKGSSFDSDKLKMVQTGTIGNKFSCNQAARIIKLFSFDSDKLKAVALFAGHLIDKENHRQIEECFTFDSDKKRARAALGL